MKPADRAWICYANRLAQWTLYPLLARDGLRMPYFVLSALFSYLLSIPPVSFQMYTATAADGGGLHWTTKALHRGSYVAMGIWHVAELTLQPPSGKPDLFVVMNVCLGAAGFATCYLWCLWKLTVESAILEDYNIVKRVDIEKKRL